jgi:uncharacterized protein (DUF2235 family)
MAKNIIICFDGTGNDFGDSLTNVAKFAKLSKFDDEKQIIFYHPGVGTDGFFRKWTKNSLKSTMGKAFGWGIADVLIDAYKFLMQTYQEGDLIFLTGFSRGAYTARAFASIIHKIGILYPGNEHLIGYLARLYLENTSETAKFEGSLCRKCQIHFLGIWDTVDSRGEADKKLNPLDVTLYPDVTFAYHALSIDEKRFMFKPVLLNENPDEHKVVEQVWFAGVHADVGGGNPESGLSDISLQWMLKKASACGLILDDKYQETIKPNIFTKICESYKGFYKLFWKPYHRQIPENANIHDSVLLREKWVKNYTISLPKKFDVVEF